MAEPAVGEFTVERTFRSGNYIELQGQITCDSTARSFQIVPTTGGILFFNAWNNDDDDTTIRIVVNSNDGTEDTDMGSVYIQTSSADDDVHRYNCGVIM